MKPCILFVDDEEKVLQGLQRTLRNMRNRWEMEFVSGGEAALKKLTELPCDVVVTDMQMPGMNGAELLDRIQKEYPEIMRIVLSGNYDQSSTFRLVREEHQYLSKPCDRELLVSTIEAALKLGAVSGDNVLQAQVNELSTALRHLGKNFFDKGMVSVVEIPLSAQESIIAAGMDPIAPILLEDYDQDIEDEFDALLNFSSDDD